MINTALLKEQLMRFWGLSALFYILFIPLFFAQAFFFEIRVTNSGFTMFYILFAPLLTVIVLYSFQNKVQSDTAMHSYPVTINQILATNSLAGMILMVMPLLIFCTIVYRTSTRFDLIFIGWYFIFRAFLCLYYFALYTLAAMLSGNTMITLLLSAALSFLPIGLIMFLVAISEFYASGVFPRLDPGDYLVFMHPILLSRWQEQQRNIGFLLALYSIITIVLAICCLITANKRALERANDFIVFPHVKTVADSIFLICSLVLMGGFLFRFLFKMFFH